MPTLRSADMRGLDLSQAQLAGASLRQAQVSGTLFPANVAAEELKLNRSGTRIAEGMSAVRPSVPTPMYEAILLDFYGTLVEEDTAALARITSGMTDAPAAGGRDSELPLAGTRFSSHCAAMRMAAIFENSGTSKSTVCACFSTSATHHSTQTSFVPNCSSIGHIRGPIAGARAFLDGLRLPVCIVSNIDAVSIRSSAPTLGLEASTHVVTSEGCRAYKPRGEPFEVVLCALCCSARRRDPSWRLESSDLKGAQSTAVGIASGRGSIPLSIVATRVESDAQTRRRACRRVSRHVRRLMTLICSRSQQLAPRGRSKERCLGHRMSVALVRQAGVRQHSAGGRVAARGGAGRALLCRAKYGENLLLPPHPSNFFLTPRRVKGGARPRARGHPPAGALEQQRSPITTHKNGEADPREKVGLRC